MAVANVFVLGMDDRNRKILEELPGADEIRYHDLIAPEQLLDLDALDLPARLAEARAVLDEFDGSVDAVVGYWDFPVTSLVPILCAELELPGPRLEGVLKCEHKYWSRQEQVRAIDDVPAFALVRLDGEPPRPPDELAYPFWLKPVKSASSRLAFRIEDERGFDRAISEIEAEIDALSEPFDHVLDRAEVPDDILEIGGRACLAEEAAVGRQFTVEGYCLDGVPHVYGVVETVLYPGTSNFQRYEYPAAIPPEVTDRLVDSTQRVMRQIGIGSGTFDIEYFWDEETDRIRLLEINPRLSQAHAQLIELVDGASNFQPMVEIGLGREPRMPHREGHYAVGAKFFPRVFEDGVVTLGPDADQIERIKRDIPGVISVVPAVEEGDRLSDLTDQDPYSYALGDLVLGADDTRQLEARYEACLDAMGLRIEAPAEAAGSGAAGA